MAEQQITQKIWIGVQEMSTDTLLTTRRDAMAIDSFSLLVQLADLLAKGQTAGFDLKYKISGDRGGYSIQISIVPPAPSEDVK